MHERFHARIRKLEARPERDGCACLSIFECIVVVEVQVEISADRAELVVS